MNHLLRRLAMAAMTAAIDPAAIRGESLVTIDMVTVGDAGNAAASDGFGAVAYDYRIGRYEVSIGQYATFLNSVAASDPYDLYNPGMGSNLNVAGVVRSGSAGSYAYGVMGDSGQRPISFVSWFDAARFCNWLHNGATQHAGTETGAYTLNGATSGIVTKNPGAGWWIPSEDEWYKAAYHKGGGTSAGYWQYPTQSDARPGNVPGDATNQVNYRRWNGSQYVFSVTQSPAYSGTQNYLAVGGAYGGSPGAYGTYDQGGSLAEWNDAVINGTDRGVRGGHWQSQTEFELARSARWDELPQNAGFNVGFRVAAGVGPLANLLIEVASGTQTQAQAGYPLITNAQTQSVTKTGHGTLVMDATNTYAGSTIVEQGTAVVQKSAAIASSSLLAVASGAALDVRQLRGGYTVRPGQSLGGAGSILGSVVFGAGSTLAPGAPPMVTSFEPLPTGHGSAASDATVAVPEPGGLVPICLASIALARRAGRRHNRADRLQSSR